MQVTKFTGSEWVVGVTVPSGVVRVRRQGKTCWTGNSGRELGSYSNSDQPAKGGSEGAQAKRMGSLDLNALLAHNATEVIRDIQVIKGSKNENYWNALKLGRPLPEPGVPFIYDKFVALLKAGGANVTRKGDTQLLTSLTDADIDKMAAGEIRNSDTVDSATLKPKIGGLFDEAVTGGTTGCFHKDTSVWTEYGAVTIGYIVEHRLDIKVWSYDFKTQKFILAPVTNWFKNHAVQGIGVARTRCKHGRLSSVLPRFSPETLWSTSKHQVYDRLGHKRDLAAADYLLAPREYLNASQTQIVIGGLLGDSHISEQAYLKITHGFKQKDYMLAKAAAFGSLVRIRPDQVDNSGGVKKPRIKCRFDTRSHIIFADYRTRWYSDTGIKYVCRADVEKLDWLGMAVWFFDDGCVTRREGNKLEATLCTHSFSKDDVLYLKDFIARRFGLASRLYRDSKYKGKTYGWKLMLASNSARKLLAGVAPYAVPCVEYKVNINSHTRNCRYCGRVIAPRFRTCACCMITKVVAGLGQAKLPKEARQRFGGSDNCRKMQAGLLAIPDDSMDLYGKWKADLNIGSCVSVFHNSNFELGLVEVPCRFEKGLGRRWEQTKIVYDIEVASTHNYFAGGMLVSNSQWGKVTLQDPLPNPAMEEPIRRLLGLTVKDFRAVLAGRQELEGGGTGGRAIMTRLADLGTDLDAKIEFYRNDAMNTRGARRDNAIKCMRYLANAKKQGAPLTAWMLTRVPVLPPVFRPVSKMGDMLMSADINDLYRDLIENNNHIKDAQGILPDAELCDAKDQLYDSLQAVMGWGEASTEEGRAKKLKGAVKSIFGDQPKHGLWQHNVTSKTMDLVARGTIAPDPELDMDSIGIPEDKAWQLYKPFVSRALVQRGFPPVKVREMLDSKSKDARDVLQKVMHDRPVIVNRAPSWHKFNVMAFEPFITDENVIRVSPLVCSGFNADFDGDAMNFHVPVGDKAVKEAWDKMRPSVNLFKLTDLKSPQHMPSKELLLGLYQMTREPSKAKPVVFNTSREAQEAYTHGLIQYNDPIIIKETSK